MQNIDHDRADNDESEMVEAGTTTEQEEADTTTEQNCINSKKKEQNYFDKGADGVMDPPFLPAPFFFFLSLFLP